MIAYLFNKLPAVKRLRALLEQTERDYAGALEEKRIAKQSLTKLHLEKEDLGAELDHVRDQRKQLQHQFGELRETVVRQAATIDVLKGERETDTRILNEQRLTIAENHGREERFMKTIDSLNETLRNRNAELEDAHAELADAQREIERRTRPVLFRSEPGMSDEQLAGVLEGKGHEPAVKAILQILDEGAVQAMNEAAQAPMLPIEEGPYANPGYTAENRGFSSGGVFALTELKRRLMEKLTPAKEERRAA